ncbi:MAG: FHA domain-containing protein [Candidatus Accumulibacter sp.]|uniref:FHA domain-containing protein n=1 Tax=Accumulibacter sp. TaxID=2053492 RepID=UPI001DA362D4|nr:FHA domain-containing protein [Accumulibacter sp.]MCB1940876.1 FHA domain-containing protein [Accumulibacter sp.]MCP5249657.1 FHA domain-containing protein [Accumulibacter sp.]
MAKLILSMDGLVLKEIPLLKERMSIGRKAHNDIQIDNMAISGEHAAVVTILSDSFLEDLNSTNGTLVNGQSVKKHFLKDGDVIELGKYKMKYLAAPVAPGEVADYDKSMLFQSGPLPDVATLGDPMIAAVAQSQASAPAAPTLPAAAIQLLSGSNAGRELPLTKTLTTLGKPGLQVAVIARRPHGYFLTHVEGAKFPTVNGRVLDGQAHCLQDHDVIEIAGVKMEFFLKT